MSDQNLCRICGQFSSQCKCIFKENGENEDLDGKIKKCLKHLKVEANDGKPQQVCNLCSRKLDEFSEFVDLSREADEKFESHLETDENPENPANFLKGGELPRVVSSDIICDNSKKDESRSSGTDNFLAGSGNDQTCYFNCFQSQPLILNGSFNDALEEIIDIIDLHNDNDSEREEHTPNNEFRTPLENNQQDSSRNSCNKSIEQEEHSRPKLDEIRKRNKRTSRKRMHKKRRGLLYFCPNCDQLYRRNRYKTYSHFRIGIKPFTCKSCQMYSVKQNLIKYIKNVNKFPVTSKRFNRFKFLLRNSLKTRSSHQHHKSKPYVCRYGDCKKAFNSRKHLLEHYASHFPDKDNIADTNIPVCGACRKKLKIKESGKRSNVCLQCGICSKKFRCRNNGGISKLRSTPTKTSNQDNCVNSSFSPSCPVQV